MEQETKFAAALVRAIEAGTFASVEDAVLKVETAAGFVTARVVTHGPGSEPSIEALTVAGETVALPRELHGDIIKAINVKVIDFAESAQEKARSAALARLTHMLEGLPK